MGRSMIQSWETYYTQGEAIVSPNSKIISSIIKQSEYFDEEILYTYDDFNTALISGKLQSGITTVLYVPQHILSVLSPPWAIKIYFPILELNQI